MKELASRSKEVDQPREVRSTWFSERFKSHWICTIIAEGYFTFQHQFYLKQKLSFRYILKNWRVLNFSPNCFITKEKVFICVTRVTWDILSHSEWPPAVPSGLVSVVTHTVLYLLPLVPEVVLDVHVSGTVIPLFMLFPCDTERVLGI